MTARKGSHVQTASTPRSFYVGQPGGPGGNKLEANDIKIFLASDGNRGLKEEKKMEDEMMQRKFHRSGTTAVTWGLPGLLIEGGIHSGVVADACASRLGVLFVARLCAGPSPLGTFDPAYIGVFGPPLQGPACVHLAS